MAILGISSLISNPDFVTSTPITGIGVQADDWFATRLSTDINRDGEYEVPVDTGAAGLWFPSDLDSADSNDVYLSLGGNLRESTATNSTQGVAAGDEIQIEFSYVVSNSTATGFTADTNGQIEFTFGNDSVTVDLFTPNGQTAPYWQEATTTITATQDYPPGTEFEIAGVSGGYIGIDALGPTTSTPPICFTPSSLIETATGLKPIGLLKVEELVLTRDNGYQPIKWLYRRSVPSTFLHALPAFNPVSFSKGCFGNGYPEKDMIVSPGHMMLVSRSMGLTDLNETEALLPAKHMIKMPGVARVSPNNGVTYVHVMCQKHEILKVDGVWSESYRPGPKSLKFLDPRSRSELMNVFPSLSFKSGKEIFQPARYSLYAKAAKRAGRQLADLQV